MKKKKTATKLPKGFEKSGFDKDTKSAPEGSPKDEAMDKKQGQQYKAATNNPVKSGVGMLDAAFKSKKGKK